jgi:anti-sigma B factor antagonist
MTIATELFAVEREGATLIVTALADLRELDYREIEAGAGDILSLLQNGTAKNVVLDLHKTDYYGSAALGLFVKLWKRVLERDGHMAFCGVSDHEREVLKITHLDGLWPIFSSREEALKAVRG